MKHFLGPMKKIGLGFGCAALAVAGLAGSAREAHAQVGTIVELVQDPNPLLGHAGGGSQGYLGVELQDVDQEKAQALKLKDVRGAVITLIDHDAPAGQIPLKINDVVIQLNGQNVEGAEQLRRMLREIPAGRKVSLVISRDGNVQTITVELADRRKIEADAWNNVYKGGQVFSQAPEKGFLDGGGSGGGVDIPGGLPGPFFGSSLNVGALVEPLTTQMAEYMGVTSGVMVKQVAKKSEAAAAGLKAFDVILKVGNEAITTLAGWDRALRSNEGKQVQVTVLRDRKQQTLTLQVDSKRHSELEWEQVFPDGSGPEMAELDSQFFGPQFAQLFGPGSETAERLREQAEQLKNQMKDWKFDPNDAKKLNEQIRGTVDSQISQQQMQEMMKQAEQWRDQMKGEVFSLDQKKLDEMKRQMEEFRKDFKPEDLKTDPKLMDDLRKQMEEFMTQVPEFN